MSAHAVPLAGANPFLAVNGLTVRFGGITALADVSFQVVQGDIHGLIGPNGAGKTTCFNCITRFYEPASGSIAFRGVDLLRRSAHEIARCGIARTFQNVALFAHMSVLDNVLVGSHASRLPERKARIAARDILDYLELGPFAARRVHGFPSARARRSSLRVRSPRSRNYSCSTSRPPGSTTKKLPHSARRSKKFAPILVPRS